MKTYVLLFVSCCLILMTGCLSDPTSAGDVSKLEEIKTQIRERFPSVNQISINEYKNIDSLPASRQIILLDVREDEEYQVSHIQRAKLSTDINDALRILKGKSKDVRIVAYCSVGYRSSALAEKLGVRGFTNVSNLEGSIFEWANKGFAVYRDGKQVKKVHPYNSTWGKLLKEKCRP